MRCGGYEIETSPQNWGHLMAENSAAKPNNETSLL